MQLLNCIFLVLLGTVHSLGDNIDEQWKNFKITHNKQYKSESDEAHRFQIFQKNLKKIETHNQLFEQGHVTYTMGINHFADLTTQEFFDIINFSKVNQTRPQSSKYLPYKPPKNVILPNRIDWREKGAVTGVKNQGNCASCWSFSATGALEGQYFLKTGKLVSLSEQYLVDCTIEVGNDGCDGGVKSLAFDYVKDNGIYSEDDYPYLAKEGDCKNVDKPKVLKVSDYYDIKEGSEEDLQTAVALEGPISVSVDATPWQHYSGGIFYDESCSSLTGHAVLVVGYGTDKLDYWLIKNSWGVNFGEKGYIRLRRNKSDQCGVASSAIYPKIVKP